MVGAEEVYGKLTVTLKRQGVYSDTTEWKLRVTENEDGDTPTTDQLAHRWTATPLIHTVPDRSAWQGPEEQPQQTHCHHVQVTTH